MDSETAKNLVEILDTSISYSNQLKTVIMRDSSYAPHLVVKCDYDRLTAHINRCSAEIIKIKARQRDNRGVK